MTKKIRVAVVFGGRNSEHAISCISASSVLANLDRDRFDIVGVGITQDGSWVLGTTDPRELELRDKQLPSVTDGTDLALAGGDLVSIDKPSAGEVLSAVDVLFPVLHGAYGEDGTIQGMFEMAGVPYAGAGVLASAAAMDKEFGKKLLAADGMSVGRFTVLRRGEDEPDLDGFGYPLFVKPARAGSSTGITKVGSAAELPAAIATAREIDPKVIIEEGVVGAREVECGVLEFPDGSVRASLPSEIRMRGDDWYDFESKYLETDERCEIDIPAKLDDAVTAAIQEQAIRAFRALDCQGLARVDFFITESGEPIVNELNTMPGFTATSAYPKMWEVTGIDYPTLLSTLIDTALARGTGLR
ncbi:D-alanine--D-alanine ligase family protein [Sciscionella sediminilitoris]|uniref:D-alanine--D-alanine ligase family protein n=1 Tax=Sciscionella sediminilitoris TaxID=1445613 RepID=UPI0004DF8560|nr:D-alanine--D-alanine ligase family protein [Sciscionella sp. SE31]